MFTYGDLAVERSIQGTKGRILFGSLAALALVFAGGFSNLVDRILFGCVRDFIDFVIFPVFNFADVFISLGVALVIYFTMMRKNETV